MTATKILELARKELSVKEAPAGSNCVKYNTAYYGRKVSGAAYPWCCVFLWWLFQSAEAPELFYGGGRTASCGALMAYAKQHRQYVTEYRAGDLVFFRFSGQGGPEHVGIVLEVRADALVTIEGNTGAGNDANGGQVQQRVRRLGTALGAFRPNYEEDEMDQTTFNGLADAWLESRAELEPSIDTEEGRSARSWAEEQEIILGDRSGRKQYRSFCTREQVLLFLYRMMEKIKR
ncbi:CHAP domain-containing protein [Oscillibacter sp.]|uniref:CHAP domain-containing protein n=1 Tax=Oscillibacter sp. TaxID=1945593 RepID=UPI00261038F7|nr:CHAP domain-containing protein [Oscillibacter sp.]MDD3346813.1 CHAP domain-containing protein [Oscillibacter sp.]